MAAADPIPDLTGLDKTAQLDALRKRMASIPGRRDHAPTELPTEPAQRAPVRSTTQGTRSAVDAVVEPGDGDSVTPAVRSRTLRTIPVPLPMAELLPRGALARGTTLPITGAGSVLAGLVAAASAAGHHVAIIGQPRFGLLAVHEHGGDLTKIALVDPGDPETALDAASICLDGVDVVTTLGGRDIPPTRARALLARCRSHASVLICTDGRMPGLDLTVESRPVAVDGIEHGRGRLRSITIDTAVHGRGTPMRTGRYTLTAPTVGTGPRLNWTPAADEQAPRTGTTASRLLAAAQ